MLVRSVGSHLHKTNVLVGVGSGEMFIKLDMILGAVLLSKMLSPVCPPVPTVFLTLHCFYPVKMLEDHLQMPTLWY